MNNETRFGLPFKNIKTENKKKLTTETKIAAIVITTLALNIFLMRPSALGQSLTPIAMIVSAATTIIYLATRKWKLTTDKQLLNHAKTITIALTIYYIYLLAITIAFNGTISLDQCKEILSVLILCILYFALLTNKDLNIKFYDTLSLTISILGWSSLATYLLMLFIPDSSLIISTINVHGYSKSDNELGTGAILFPLTMLYGKFTSGDIYLLRVAGFFREAGIYQAISCFFLLYEFFHKNRTWVIIGLATGAILSLSSMGLICLCIVLATIGYHHLKNRSSRIIFFTTILTLTYPVFMYTPYIGYTAKENTHGSSFSERTQSMARGIEAVSINPLGYGVKTHKTENSSINMIAAMGSIGILGFLLQVLIISGVSNKKNWTRLAIFSPILLTALIAQPLIGSPFIYILSLAAINTINTKKDRKITYPKNPPRTQ